MLLMIFNDSDILIWYGNVYVSDQLHTYVLQNVLLAFCIGMVLGVMLGITADSWRLLLFSRLYKKDNSGILPAAGGAEIPTDPDLPG